MVLGVRRETSGTEPSYSVTIRSASSGNPDSTHSHVGDEPGQFAHFRFETSEFEATGSIDLDSNKMYFVVLEPKAGSSAIDIVATDSGAEDPGPASGSSLGNHSRSLNSGSWSDSSLIMYLAIQGYEKSGSSANSGPSFHSASVKRKPSSRVKFDEPLDEDSPPPGDAFKVKTTPDGGGTGTRSGPGQGEHLLRNGPRRAWRPRR